MKIISCNIKGVGRKGFYSQAKNLISNYKSNFLALKENRVNASKAHKKIKRINLPYFIEVPPEGFYRAIWLIWKNNAKSGNNIIKTHHSLFIVKSGMTILLGWWFCSRISSTLFRKRLKKEISNLDISCNETWIIVRDLNELTSVQEN